MVDAVCSLKIDLSEFSSLIHDCWILLSTGVNYTLFLLSVKQILCIIPWLELQRLMIPLLFGMRPLLFGMRSQLFLW